MGLYVSNLEYTKQYDENMKWDLDDFKKEMVSGTVIERFGDNHFRKV